MKNNTYTLSGIFVVLLLFFTSGGAFAQNSKNLTFWEKPDTLNKTRFITASAFSTVTYSSFTYGLYNTWYKKFDQEPFHLYNDWGEWRHMDKAGHFYTAYFQGVLCFKGAQWTGLSKKNSIWTGFILGSLFQSTIEVMDGFSTKWGFSLPDVAFNFAGSSAFVVQQAFWDEQRITFKVSNIPKGYSDTPIPSVDMQYTSSLRSRANNLYGASFAERFLKDYNSQVIWASFNIESFLPGNSAIPDWLNLSIGYGAGNMFGGYENKWEENGISYQLEDPKHRRYSSIYISPDIDLWKIRTKNKAFNSVLDVLNIFKIPLPALEYNTLGEFHFHFFI